MGILGMFDGALVDGLDAWAGHRVGSTDAAVRGQAASAKATDGVLQRMNDAGRRDQLTVTSREAVVAAAVEMLSAGRPRGR
jgi:hypothetical protein